MRLFVRQQVIHALNNRSNVLTGQYDIYQDLVDPSKLSSLPGVSDVW